MDALNYDEVTVPEGKNPHDYDSIERRADLLRIIYREGHPYAVPQAVLGQRYNVTQQQISKDMQELREFISSNMGNDVEVRTKLAFEKIYRSLLDKGEDLAAWKVVMDWTKWIDDRGRKAIGNNQQPYVITFQTLETDVDNHAKYADQLEALRQKHGTSR